MCGNNSPNELFRVFIKVKAHFSNWIDLLSQQLNKLHISTYVLWYFC